MEDEEIIKNIRKGNEMYMEMLIQKYYPEILRYCVFQVQNTAQAEDITQDTFLAFVKNFHTYRHRGKCRSYLFSIAHNLCVDLFRKQSRRVFEQSEESMDQYTSDKVNKDVSIHMSFYLKQLQSMDQEILLLRFYYDFTFQEVANVLSMPVSSVKYHTKQSLLRLQNIMKEDEIQWR